MLCNCQCLIFSPVSLPQTTIIGFNFRWHILRDEDSFYSNDMKNHLTKLFYCLLITAHHDHIRFWWFDKKLLSVKVWSHEENLFEITKVMLPVENISHKLLRRHETFNLTGQNYHSWYYNLYPSSNLWFNKKRSYLQKRLTISNFTLCYLELYKAGIITWVR